VASVYPCADTPYYPSFPLTYPTGDPNIQFRIELGPPRWSGRCSSRRSTRSCN